MIWIILYIRYSRHIQNRPSTVGATNPGSGAFTVVKNLRRRVVSWVPQQDDQHLKHKCTQTRSVHKSKTLTTEVSVPIARKRPSGERSKAVTWPELPRAWNQQTLWIMINCFCYMILPSLVNIGFDTVEKKTILTIFLISPPPTRSQ